MELIKINDVNLYRTKPRLRCADREQEEIRPRLIENLIEEGHRARIVWDFVEGLDLSELYDQIKSVEGYAVRPAIDPKILMAVWLYAILDHEISARRIADFCEQHSAYIWLCGGVKINHHTLSDFYTAHEQWLNKQFTLHLASLKHQGLIDLDRVAQDGIRVRACAGADSFLCCETLESCLKEADEYLEKIRRERSVNPAEADKRRQAAHERAAGERVREALRQLPEVEASRQKEEDRKKARVSTTDPDAKKNENGRWRLPSSL